MKKSFINFISKTFNMLALFSRYFSVGILNTLIHWIVFSLIYLLGQPQVTCNFIAFIIAVTFSFFANAKWTFKAKATSLRYGLYLTFMGLLALVVGYCADKTELKPVITLCLFSLISLIFGFLYSRYIVFRGTK